MTRRPLARAPPPQPFRSSWEPGKGPEAVPDELLGHVLRELAKMGVALLLVACVLAALLFLGGCAEGGSAIGPGGVSAPFRGALVNDDQHFQCVEDYDPTTGKVSIKVVFDRGNHVDDTGLHEIAGVATAAIGAGKTAGTVAAGVRGDYPQPIPPPLHFPACFGTQSLGYAPPAPPNPTPPYPPPAASPPASPTLLQPGFWYEGLGGHTRLLDGVSADTACWRSGQGAKHCADLAAWRAWVRRPLPSADTPRTGVAP